VLGISVITAALVILLSAFNGIEQLVNQLYTSYDPAIVVRSEQGKTFDSTLVNLDKLRKLPGVISLSKAVEETVIIKRENKWVNARMVGVEASFLTACDIENHMVDGYPSLEENGVPTAIIGASLLDKLDGYISDVDGFDQLQLYTPLRDASISRLKSPFKITPIKTVGRMNYNKEVNGTDILVPFDFAQEQLNYQRDITAIYLDVAPAKREELKAEIKQLLGASYTVKTAAEKNELIFKTSQSEKKIVFIILIFIFILAAFNLVASLNMLFIEKRDNIQTLKQLGSDKQLIFKIFFYEGLLISAKGILGGLILGIGICLIQLKFHILTMPNTPTEGFPIVMNAVDILKILITVSLLSVSLTYLPVRYLVKKFN
jgi:lipoprotein-releasing system permease protein